MIQMPGPPECLPTGFPHEGAAINAPGCLLHARSYHANSKRFKDTECAAEYWRAVYEYERERGTMYDHKLHIVLTFNRFFNYPHVLENS